VVTPQPPHRPTLIEANSSRQRPVMAGCRLASNHRPVGCSSPSNRRRPTSVTPQVAMMFALMLLNVRPPATGTGTVMDPSCRFRAVRRSSTPSSRRLHPSQSRRRGRRPLKCLRSGARGNRHRMVGPVPQIPGNAVAQLAAGAAAAAPAISLARRRDSAGMSTASLGDRDHRECHALVRRRGHDSGRVSPVPSCPEWLRPSSGVLLSR